MDDVAIEEAVRHAAVMGRQRIVLGAGSRNAKVLAPPEIRTALGAEVVADLAKPA